MENPSSFCLPISSFLRKIPNRGMKMTIMSIRLILIEIIFVANLFNISYYLIIGSPIIKNFLALIFTEINKIFLILLFLDNDKIEGFNFFRIIISFFIVITTIRRFTSACQINVQTGFNI